MSTSSKSVVLAAMFVYSNSSITVATLLTCLLKECSLYNLFFKIGADVWRLVEMLCGWLPRLTENLIHTGSYCCTPYYLVKYYNELLSKENSERGNEAWMKLHFSILVTFLAYTLTLSMSIFKKKSARKS